MKRKLYIYKSYIALAFGVLLFLSGCEIKFAQLRALENLASVVQLTTGCEVRRFTHNAGSSLGKPVYAEVLILYEPIDHYTKKDIYDEIVDVLKKNNWKGNEPNLGRDYFKASLQQGGFEIDASVVIFSDENLVSLHLVDYHHPSAGFATDFPTSTPLPTPIPRATNATPELKINLAMMKGKDGMTLLYVPAGEFTMGSDNSELHEKPVHTVYLDAFWIDQTEVTNEMYAKCVQVGQCDPPGTSPINYIRIPGYAKHPVVYVDWKMANAYCSWVARRLPTEAEWEKAARGAEAFTYPWGEGLDCDKANYQRSCVGETSPVGSYEKGKSPYDAYDMAGNALEWVNDWYGESYYQNSPPSNPSGPDSGNYRVLRGGSWKYFDFDTRSAYRYWSAPTYSDSSYGFRCARSHP